MTSGGRRMQTSQARPRVIRRLDCVTQAAFKPVLRITESEVRQLALINRAPAAFYRIDEEEAFAGLPLTVALIIWAPPRARLIERTSQGESRTETPR